MTDDFRSSDDNFESHDSDDNDDYVQLGKTGIYHPVVKEKEGEVA